jgi:hypothetical protein
MTPVNIEDLKGSPAFRNTWISAAGRFVTRVYRTREGAIKSAIGCPQHKYQEVATPVHPEQCFSISPEEMKLWVV